MKVKVCGITTKEDALAAVGEGADALGFNFYSPSPRCVDPESARAIISQLPPFVVAVGLFVNVPDPREVEKIARAASVAALQLHGDESPDYCAELSGWPLIKALHVGAGSIPEGFERYPVSAFLLDTLDENLFGGTGRTFDWGIAAQIHRVRPLILAGGLKPQNVALAIRTVRPYAVDVCSGVERSPGKKDRAKLHAFMREVSHACEDL